MQQKGLLRKMTHVALLVALEIVLNRFLSFQTFNLKIGFSFIPVVLAAMLYGPVWGGITAGLGDFLGAILIPKGPYFPGFTLTALLMGLVYGLFLHKRVTLVRNVASVAIVRLVLSLGLNTLWISVLYGKGFMGLLPGRLAQELVMIPVQVIVIWFMGAKLPKLLKRPV